MVSTRVRELGLTVDTEQLSPTVSLADALDSAAQEGLLYAVIITSQHEMHSSVTLTILHGRNPQGVFFAAISVCVYVCMSVNVPTLLFTPSLSLSSLSLPLTFHFSLSHTL